MPHSQDESLYFEPRRTSRLRDSPSPKSSLFRVYSENERANFDQNTGSRVYDDDRHRPIPRVHPEWGAQSKQRRYSLDVAGKKRNLDEMQDEYIPEIDFADELTKWFDDEPQPSPSNPSFNDAWSEALGEEVSPHTTLNSLHSQVKPIPLPNAARGSILATQTGSPQKEPENFDLSRGNRSKRRSGVDSISSSLGDISSNALQELKMTPDEVVELIGRLPEDYVSMPYSQRKKVVMDLVPARDYRVLMSWLKKYMLTSPKSGASLHKRGSFVNSAAVARSRQSSIASQYLNSFSPANMGFGCNSAVARPDDKGSLILGHILGKIIGFGAWGMIKECVNVQDGTVRAMKIVRFKNNNKVKRQVIKEVSIWKELKHRNLLRLSKWRLDEDYAMYCLTDRINGGTLYDLVISWGEIETSKVSREERCKMTILLCLQIVKALKYMHGSYITHGDVKLENCLLDKDVTEKGATVLLCDFGMSTYFRPSNSNVPQAPETLSVDPYESIEFTSPLDGHKITTSKKPSIPKSQSHASIRGSGYMSELQKIIKNKKLTHDDTPLGVSSLPRTYGPALSSARIHNTSEPSLHHLVSPATKLMPTMDVASPHSGSDPSNVPDPHSHIGSLPYAAPELLEPSPPPLGPSADIWALGVTLYAMLTGKLPFRHDFEPRLRAMIASGKYKKSLLEFACQGGSAEMFKGLFDVVAGCLTVNINTRWSLAMIEDALNGDMKQWEIRL